jgi:hypothetical protein
MNGCLIAGLIGIAMMGFWPIYDRVKDPNTKSTAGAETQQTVLDIHEYQAPLVCPVCGEAHDVLHRHGSCPFEKSEYHAVAEEDLLDSMYTNTGGHFEFRFLVWQYKDMIYLTYMPDNLAAQRDKDGNTLVSAYYSTGFCHREDWDPESIDMNFEMSREVVQLREREMNSIHETKDYYVVGLDRILDMSVTKEAGCAKTGYVVWQGTDGIYVTGLTSWADPQIFNYDRISRSGMIHRFHKAYTRRLCDTLDELREMPQDKIDGQAYGAYMDGAR